MVEAQANATQFKGTFGPAGPAKSLITGELFPVDDATNDSGSDTWITIGANCPWNSTPGKRQTWRNGKMVNG